MKIPTLFLMSLAISFAIAAERPERGPGKGHRPQLTDEQRTCLEAKLGARDGGNRPTKEAMDAAFSSCGIEKLKAPPTGEAAPQQDNQDSSQSIQ